MVNGTNWFRRLRPFRNERAAVAVGRGDKASGHVVAEERTLRAVGTVGDRQRAAGVTADLGIRKRRVEAEGDARQTGSRRATATTAEL